MLRFIKKSKDKPAGRNHTPEQQAGSVFSYYSSRARNNAPLGRTPGSDAQSPTVFARPGWQLLPSWLALLAILVSTGYMLTLDTNPKIIVADDKKPPMLRNEQTYQQAAQEFLRQSLASRLKITIDARALSRHLEQQFPELQAAVVTLPLAGHRPVISLTAAEPSVMFSSLTGRYVLDGTGRVILEVDDVDNKATQELPIVIDESGLNIEVGETALPGTTVGFIRDLAAQLAAKQLTPESMTLPAIANELHVRFKDQPYFVKFNTVSDPRQSAGALLAIKQRLEGKGTIPHEYIDLRIAERAYYR